MKLKSAAPTSVCLALLLCSCGRAPTGAASGDAAARPSDQACAPSGELAYVCGPVNAEDVLQIGESSLYPALQRLLLNGFLDAEWRPSENNRRARYYTLTRAGRKHLAGQETKWEKFSRAMRLVLRAAGQEGQ